MVLPMGPFDPFFVLGTKGEKEMASSFQPNVRTYKAGGVIAANRFVKYGADKNHVVQCGAGDHAIGISLGAATAAENEIEIGLPGGGAKLDIAGTVGLGKKLKSDSNGKGIYVTTAADWVGALSVEDGVSGDTIGVHVVVFETSGAES